MTESFKINDLGLLQALFMTFSSQRIGEGKATNLKLYWEFRDQGALIHVHEMPIKSLMGKSQKEITDTWVAQWKEAEEEYRKARAAKWMAKVDKE